MAVCGVNTGAENLQIQLLLCTCACSHDGNIIKMLESLVSNISNIISHVQYIYIQSNTLHYAHHNVKFDCFGGYNEWMQHGFKCKTFVLTHEMLVSTRLIRLACMLQGWQQ